MTVIKVENLSKKYILRHQQREAYTALRDVMAHGAKRLGAKLLSPFTVRSSRSALRPPPSAPCAMPSAHSSSREDFWALKDVSFEVKQGERVGIIGRNGAGKSTLLKILSRITEPTTGSVKIRGRVASLLEVGTGFHPELTGRENVYLNGAILGMGKAEIKKKFDAIVDFAEIEKFLDTPVKRYSSGMYVRLAFAVAAHLDPELLIIDEVLAVGDGAFQKKCLGKMSDVAREGRTILFVSHNMQAVETLCSKGIVLNRGRIEVNTNSAEAVNYYLKNLFMMESTESLKDRTDRRGNGSIRVISIVFYNEEGVRVNSLKSGERCRIDFEYEATRELTNVSIAFTVRDASAQYLFRPSSEDAGHDFEVVPKHGYLRCRIPRLPLVPGRYRITPRLTSNSVEEDWVEGAAVLIVAGGDFFGSGKMSLHSPVILDHSWSLQEYAYVDT